MTLETIIQVILFGIALAMDAFAVSITSGLTYTNIKKKHHFFIAGDFGFMQGFMPLLGFFLVELIEIIVDTSASDKAGKIMSDVVSIVSCVLLLFIGIKMIVEGIKSRKEIEENKQKLFSYKEILIYGVATSIDALATGVAFHNKNLDGISMSTNTSIFLHVAIIMVITFIISLIGLFLGKQISKILKGRYEITSIIGGSILILLGIWIILSHYLGI